VTKAAADGEAALAALPSLGATSARMLVEAGVPDPNTLRALGPIGAWRRLRFHFGKRAKVNFAYAMECAIEGSTGAWSVPNASKS
jgi:TfoX C-terminal domain